MSKQLTEKIKTNIVESEQIWWTYVKLDNIAEIYSAWIDSSKKVGAQITIT